MSRMARESMSYSGCPWQRQSVYFFTRATLGQPVKDWREAQKGQEQESPDSTGNQLAFGPDAEARLVDGLRDGGYVEVSQNLRFILLLSAPAPEVVLFLLSSW